jgi:hypothetical protein
MKRPLLTGAAAVTIAAILLLVVVVLVAGRDTSVTHRFVIPPGTRDLLEKGVEPPGMPPDRLRVSVGDTLEIVNNDSVAHTYGFMVMKPGETSTYTFRRAGEFQGACTVALHSAVVISVT